MAQREPEEAARQTPSADPAPVHVRPRPRGQSRQMNRIFALALTSFAAFVFLIVIMATIMLHYAETHHAALGF